jgi:hypothetical protein
MSAPYILISVWSPEDEATRHAHAFAQKLDQRRPAVHFLDGEAPPHDAVKQAVATAPDAPVVIFSHGGSHLAPRRGGPRWSDAQELAQLLSGRRVYVFACDTFTPQQQLMWQTFAENAVAACIAVFAGYCSTISAPTPAHQLANPHIDTALFHLIEAFLDGEQDPEALQLIGRTYGSADLEFPIDLASEDPEQNGAFGWTSAQLLQKFFNDLRVDAKAPESPATAN